tara:strand:+ start:253 stop:426 length:174 start_codon:yes stop_codon:yes gene_type:complete
LAKKALIKSQIKDNFNVKSFEKFQAIFGQHIDYQNIEKHFFLDEILDHHSNPALNFG